MDSNLFVLGTVVLGIVTPVLVQLAKRLARHKYSDWGLEVEGNFAHLFFIGLSGLLSGVWLILTGALAPAQEPLTALQAVEYYAGLALLVYTTGTGVYFKYFKPIADRG